MAALAACSVATERPKYDNKFDEEDGGNGATTERAGDAGNGPGISGDTTKPEYEAPPNEIDLTKVEPCDDDLDVDGNVKEFLKAIGLCKMAESDEEWGVLEAKFNREFSDSEFFEENNDKGQHGILEKFGDEIEPREGARLGVLSTGWAREYNSSNGNSGKFTSGESWKRTGSTNSSRNDMIVLAVKIRVPTNAKSFSFDFNFHSAEWPSFVGDDFNDEFRVNLAGSNISFDVNNNPVNVNTGFFDRCTPNYPLPNGTTSECTGGPNELDGTGFAGSPVTSGGATGWLTTKAPVEPGSIIELEFAIWDTKDQGWDSLVLIDNFKWDAEPATTGTTRPVN